MCAYQVPSLSLRRKLSLSNDFRDIAVEEVADTVVQLVVNFDVRPERIDNAAWVMAQAVDAVADYLDCYENMTFRAFCVFFSAAWYMHEARKTKDRRKPLR